MLVRLARGDAPPRAAARARGRSALPMPTSSTRCAALRAAGEVQRLVAAAAEVAALERARERAAERAVERRERVVERRLRAERDDEQRRVERAEIGATAEIDASCVRDASSVATRSSPR